MFSKKLTFALLTVSLLTFIGCSSSGDHEKAVLFHATYQSHITQFNEDFTEIVAEIERINEVRKNTTDSATIAGEVTKSIDLCNQIIARREADTSDYTMLKSMAGDQEYPNAALKFQKSFTTSLKNEVMTALIELKKPVPSQEVLNTVIEAITNLRDEQIKLKDLRREFINEHDLNNVTIERQ